jgi:hypothetical protein
MSPAKPFAILFSVTLICAHTLHAQSSTTVTTISANTYTKTAAPGKSVFPQWARDLRRAEIVAFGSFPFMMFISTFSVDAWRYFGHDMNVQYAPWPFKGAGAVEMSTGEYQTTLFTAIAGSVVLALADHLIVRFKRIKAERQRLDLPEGELIILREPWPPEEASGDAADAP